MYLYNIIKNNNKMITITQNKGFQLTFENGLTISVQIGTGNYCERRQMGGPYNSEMNEEVITSSNAEIAIWDNNNNWLNFGSDTVKGWVPAEEIGQYIEMVRTFDPTKSLLLSII